MLLNNMTLIALLHTTNVMFMYLCLVLRRQPFVLTRPSVSARLHNIWTQEWASYDQSMSCNTLCAGLPSCLRCICPADVFQPDTLTPALTVYKSRSCFTVCTRKAVPCSETLYLTLPFAWSNLWRAHQKSRIHPAIFLPEQCPVSHVQLFI